MLLIDRQASKVWNHEFPLPTSIHFAFDLFEGKAEVTWAARSMACKCIVQVPAETHQFRGICRFCPNSCHSRQHFKHERGDNGWRTTQRSRGRNRSPLVTLVEKDAIAQTTMTIGLSLKPVIGNSRILYYSGLSTIIVYGTTVRDTWIAGLVDNPWATPTLLATYAM